MLVQPTEVIIDMGGTTNLSPAIVYILYAKILHKVG